MVSLALNLTAQHVDPCIRSKDSEISLPFYGPCSLNASLAIWSQKLDSELLFIGDASNTEASRSSRRYGAELTAYYQFNDCWVADSGYTYSNSLFSEDDLFAAKGNYEVSINSIQNYQKSDSNITLQCNRIIRSLQA